MINVRIDEKTQEKLLHEFFKNFNDSSKYDKITSVLALYPYEWCKAWENKDSSERALLVEDLVLEKINR